jgi:hypothetical protein
MKYRIVLGADLIAESTNELIAWAGYRAVLRRGDLRTQKVEVTLWGGDELLESGTAGEILADGGPVATPNAIFKQLIAGRFTEGEISAALRHAGFPISNSRLQGWLAGPDNRRHQPMTLDELYVVVAALPEM